MKLDIDQIPKFVIHNMDRKDREESFIEEFKIVFPNQNIRIFPAIMIKGDGKRGCWKSFQEVLKIAKSENMEHVLVMEDDIMFPRVEGIREYIKESFNNLPEQETWNLLEGGCYTGKQWPFNNYWVRMVNFSSTHFSFFHKSSYDRIIEFDSDADSKRMNHIDRWLGRGKEQGGGGLLSYCSSPCFALQKPSYSDITKQTVAYRMPNKIYRGFTQNIRERDVPGFKNPRVDNTPSRFDHKI